MAQVCGGAPYDDYRERMATALSFLQKLAEQWAVNGEEAIDFDAALALMCRVILSPFTAGLPLSFGVCLAQMASPEAEMRRCARGIPGCTPDEALVELSEVLAIAGESWCLGDPESPPTERVLHAMAMVLYGHHLLRRRPAMRAGG